MITRACLKHNKIYFETITAALLAIMAIMVSVAQYRMMREQNQISVANSLPQIISTIHYIKDNKDKYSDEFIEVTNEGGVIKEPVVSELILLEIHYTSVKPAIIKKLNVPVLNYYNVMFSTGNGKGVIAKAYGKENNSKFSELNSRIISIKKQDLEFLFININRIIRIKYTDIFGKTHTEYQLVTPQNGSRTLPITQGQIAFSSLENTIKNGNILEFNKISADYIYSHIRSDLFDSMSINIDKLK